MNVNNFDPSGKTATLKIDHTKPLEIGGMVEGVHYKILKINNPKITNEEDPPLVGESISILYSFKPYRNCQFGYEHLCLFIGRLNKTGKNYVKYFKNPLELKRFMKGMEVEIDKKYAKNRIKTLENDIEKLKRVYNLS